MFKYFGLTLIIIVCGYTGHMMAASLSGRIKELELAIALVGKLQTHIKYRRTPTIELIEEMAGYELFAPLCFIRDCGESLKVSSNFTAVWKNSLDSNRGRLRITNEDISLLMSMGDYLGNSDAEGQIKALQFTETALGHNLKDAREQNAAKGKMYRSLGVLAGMGIAVFLI
ncbi:MAG: stage III sporulation protein AB [Oscillospiraceae bacterium]|nr:stage III sporulation protein AB [Oscillospiraceae bacterium]